MTSAEALPRRMSAQRRNPKRNGWFAGVPGVGLLVLLTGCSVVIAAGSGTPGFDPGTIQVGVARDDVEACLGQPVASEVDLDGNRISTYAFRARQAPSTQRGNENLVMDLLTLGTWELIGTANVLILDPSRRTREITLIFDPRDRLVKIVPPVRDTSRPGEAPLPAGP